MAFAGPLEPVTAPVSKTIETITAPITGSPPSAPSVSTPPPVQIPAPRPVKPPTPSIKQPATSSLEPVTSAVEPTATSPVASAQNRVEAIADEVTEVAGAARESSAPAQGSREDPAETLSGAAAAATIDPVERHLQAARVAPPGDRFVRIWPAVALGRLTLGVLPGDLPRATLRSIFGPAGARSFAAGHPGGESGSGDDGFGDLASSVDLPGLSRLFVPESPLPPAMVYIALAGGMGAIWYLSRREVGRRTVSRRRRL